MSSSNLITIAVVGAGHWGPNLLRNFDAPPASRVKTVVDRDRARLDQVLGRFPHVQVSENLDGVLADPAIEAMVIATPTSTHYQLVKAALNARKHVLVEKPITTRTEEAEELSALADRLGLVLMVGHVFVFNQAVQRVRSYIESGELGRVYYVSMVRTNLGPIRMDVNASWDLISHDVSIVNYWLGTEPETVSAVGGSWINPGIEDAVFATLRYPNSVLVNVHASWLNPRKAREITVAGDKRMLTFDDMNLLEPVRIYDKQVIDKTSKPGFIDSFASFRASVRDGDIIIPKISSGEPLKAECDHFLDCVRNGKRPLVSGREATAVVRALEGIDRSMRDQGREQVLAATKTGGASMATKIPLIDLGAQHREIAAEVAAGFAAVFETTSFILGKHVKEFEEAYAKFSGSKHCVGVANGTDALELALRAVGVGEGDEVILPANTFIATALAVSRAGARPVLVDCDNTYQLIDVAAIERRITSRTKAIIPVHLFGQMAPIEPLTDLAGTKRLALVEDGAQSQGAVRNGKRSGTVGIVAGTSFYPGKNLGAYGDAGAITTDADDIAAKVVALRNYGSDVKYHHPETGFNSRLDTLQAVVLSAKLSRLARWNEARRKAAARYDELLAGVPAVELPRTMPGNEHVWHLYVVRVQNRDTVLAKLNAEGIGAGIHYPIPIHLQGAFSHLGHKVGDFPVAERAAAEILSLPMFPEITGDQQARVVDVLKHAVS